MITHSVKTCLFELNWVTLIQPLLGHNEKMVHCTPKSLNVPLTHARIHTEATLFYLQTIKKLTTCT
jgi:hypothetical protein